jgi:hypothetical protein
LRRGDMHTRKEQRSLDEIICDLLAEGYELDEIADKLLESIYVIETRFKVIVARLGRQAA